MKFFTKTGIVISLLLVWVNVIFAQTYDELLKNTSGGKDITERLPSIAELQAKAIANSPTLKYIDTDIEVKNYQIKTEKRVWMKQVGVETGAKYGLFDNLVISEDIGQGDINTQTTEQTRYYLGVYLKLPLSSVVDKSSINAAKSEVEKVRYQKQKSEQELNELVIKQYYSVVRAHRSIIVKANAVESYRVQMLRAKMDFENNQISVAEYSRLNDMLLNSITSLEDVKIEFEVALQLLEETIGEEIKIKKFEN
ncbi:hypothetical protein GM418_19085 [Maribellus comscasis]|uniref:TolC family protein n=1 Tax=Maribellus comscasis TaxID=2681766 RepID=A0A6I6JX63_9BACT|nr:TolC family protein [Maribellus comscasis]QGY45698.1 hypothetical protein GM418_19085 [Maribellus comscasis]